MSVNVLQNGKIVELAGAVDSNIMDQAVDLAVKTAVATASAYVEKIVAEAGGFHTKVVDRLPLGSEDPEDEEYIALSTLYFVPNKDGSLNDNVYDEYMYIDDKWELINDKVRSISESDIDELFK